MSALRRLRVGIRLSLAFALVLLLLVAMLGIGLSNMSAANDDTQRIVGVDFRKTHLTSVALDNARGSMARLFQLSQDGGSQTGQARDRFNANVKAAKEALDELEPMLRDEKSVSLMGRARETGRDYLAASQSITEAMQAGRTQEARELTHKQAYAALHAFAAALRELNDHERALLEANGRRSAEAYVGARSTLLVMGALAMALAAVAAWAVTRSITVPLRQAADAVTRVGAGDLTVEVHDSGRDETAQLLAALGQMVDRLQRLVSSVRSSVDAFAHASEEIAAGNQDLSQRTEQAAASLQQTASSMEQLNGTVRNSADHAVQANRLAAGAGDVARRGGTSMEAVVGTMEDISANSIRIADIVGVIDGIAFQTNILALNAAVEAARAGEQGRGFAVVAGEVRQLAQRSGEAAREIKGLIGTSADKVEAGRRMVRDAGETMQQIVASVEQVTGIVREIASAASEQSDGIGQVSVAVAQLDQVTQQNAALVEESAAAAASLKAQAQQLTEVVSVFRVRRSGGEPGAAPASAFASGAA